MELSRHAPAPARYTGLGLVIGVHVVAITALSLAFMPPAAQPKQAPIVLLPPPLDTPDTPREPPPVVKAARPDLPRVPVPDVPIPDWQTEAPTVTAAPLRSEGTPVPTSGGTGTGVAPLATAQEPAAVRAPGAVCSVMPRPELPMLGWSGQAVLHAVATVRGGRVVGSDIRVTQGALDAKSRRALQRSVETALAGYQCVGDALFEQEFAFRLD